LDQLPQVGDVVTIDDLEVTVLEMEAHRIAKVRVRRVAAAPAEDTGEPELQQDEAKELVLPIDTVVDDHLDDAPKEEATVDFGEETSVYKRARGTR
jgi:hypothetical protein